MSSEAFVLDGTSRGAFASGVIVGWLSLPEQRTLLVEILERRERYAHPFSRSQAVRVKLSSIAEASNLAARLKDYGLSLDDVDWTCAVEGIDALERWLAERENPL